MVVAQHARPCDRQHLVGQGLILVVSSDRRDVFAGDAIAEVDARDDAARQDGDRVVDGLWLVELVDVEGAGVERRGIVARRGDE